MIKIKNDAIDFAEWLRTFEPLTKENGYWVLECQISSEKLYKAYVRDKSEALKKDSTSEQLEHDALLVDGAKRSEQLVCDVNNNTFCKEPNIKRTGVCRNCGGQAN